MSIINNNNKNNNNNIELLLNFIEVSTKIIIKNIRDISFYWSHICEAVSQLFVFLLMRIISWTTVLKFTLNQ